MGCSMRRGGENRREKPHGFIQQPLTRACCPRDRLRHANRCRCKVRILTNGSVGRKNDPVVGIRRDTAGGKMFPITGREVL